MTIPDSPSLHILPSPAMSCNRETEKRRSNRPGMLCIPPVAQTATVSRARNRKEKGASPPAQKTGFDATECAKKKFQ